MVEPCAHANTKRGDDIPRRYGSYRSRVCVDCGAFEARTHFDELAWPWRPSSEYAEATRKDDET